MTEEFIKVLEKLGIKETFNISRILSVSPHSTGLMAGWTGLSNITAEGMDSCIYDIDFRKIFSKEFLKQDLFDHDNYEKVSSNNIKEKEVIRHKIIIYLYAVKLPYKENVVIKQMPERFVLGNYYRTITHIYTGNDPGEYIAYIDKRTIKSEFSKLTSFSTTRRLINERPDILGVLSSEPKKKAEGGLRTKGLYKKNSSDKPLISVITVVFNGEKHIEQTIQSVINQTYDNVEYIVVDGGSKDGTIDIVKKYEQEIDYWVSEPDKGIVDAMNKGIRLCTGEYIGMIHADDWYNLNAIDDIVNSNNVLQYGVICGQLQYWNNGNIYRLYISQPSLLKNKMHVSHITCFIKRQKYLEYGSYKMEYKNAMDYELLLRFYINQVHFNSLSVVLANMRYGGISNRTWKACLLENHIARKKLIPESFYSSSLYFFLYSMKVTFALGLEKYGLGFIVKNYRKKFSLPNRA